MTTLTVTLSLLGSAPILSLPTGLANGATAYTGTVTSDTAGGTLWHVVSTAATAPSAAQIKLGLDHTGSLAAAAGAQIPGAAGQVTVGGAGLSESTSYYLHYLQSQDGRDSNIVTSASFTTGALGSGSGTVAITILDRSNLQIAPEGVFFRASVADASITENSNRSAYDPSWHDVTYVWSFGDIHAVSDKVTNVAASQNDLNSGYGKEVGHTFTRPGTYTVTCDAYGPGGYIGRGTEVITVGDPDALFTGNRTILVGSADAAYPGAQVVSTLDQGRAALEALNTTGRVLVQRGHVETTGTSFFGTDSYENIYVSTYGTGARPQITATNGFALFGGWDSFAGRDMVIQGLDCTGGWNPQSETGNRGLSFLRAQALTNASMVVDDCIAKNFGLSIYAPSTGAAGGTTNLHINNTLVEGYAEYALFTFITGPNDITSCTGVGLLQDPLANSGGSGQIGNGNTQGPFRSNTGGRYYFDCCDFFSRCSWTPAGDPWYQSCVRFNSRLTDAASAVFTRCAMESGGPVFSCTESEGGGHARVHSNVLVDKTLMVGSHHTLDLIEVEVSGFTFQNCICVMPEQPARSGFNTNWIDIKSGGVANGSVPLKVRHCTFIDNRPSSQGLAPNSVFSGDTGKLSAETEENNVFQFDQQTGREFENADLSTTQLATVGGQWTSRYLGEKRGGVPLNTFRATPPDSVKTYRPNAGSPVISDASGLVAYDDFTGAVRSSPDRGAVAR